MVGGIKAENVKISPWLSIRGVTSDVRTIDKTDESASSPSNPSQRITS